MSESSRILAAELTAVRGELVRVDAKCATLTGLAGAGLAFLLQVSTGRLEVAVRVLLAAAALCWAAAALLLLVRVLRPHLGGTGLCRWADMSAGDVLGCVGSVREDTHTARELVVLSQIAVRKYRALRKAVALLSAGVVLAVASVLAGVW
jgi:hypothetical protein